MARHLLVGALLGLLTAVTPMRADAKPIRVLILTGQNNHAWQETTPVLRSILEDSGRFTVEVTEHPEALTASMLDGVDVILSNWNAWGDAAVKAWSEPARTALLEFVRHGRGFVSVHAGTSSFYDWKDYQELAIAAWGLGVTGHGSRHDFRVAFTDASHPISRGMTSFTIHDELWHSVPIQPGATILATAYSSVDAKGSGKDEPMVMVRDFGKGRSVNILLGHDAQAMRCPSFGLLLGRSLEWAATNRVTLPARVTEWVRDSEHLELRVNGETLWRFNFGAGLSKPYFHPLQPAGGPVISWDAPPDHVWHHGLWFSWKFINGVNYWEEDPATGRAAGATVWKAPTITTKPNGKARIVMDLAYEAEPGKPVLTERRTLDLSPPDSSGDFTIDWSSRFIARTEQVVLDRTPIEGEPDGKSWGGYAGLSMRFAAMTHPTAATDRGDHALDKELSNTDAEAADYSGDFGGRPAGLAIVQGPGSPVSPTPWYFIATPGNAFYFYSPALLYRAPMTIHKGERFTLRYRIHVHHGRWTGGQVKTSLESPSRAKKPSTGEEKR